MYALGERLHKSLDEIGAMSVEEFNGWLAFFDIRSKAHGNN